MAPNFGQRVWISDGSRERSASESEASVGPKRAALLK